jgi:tripartite-type tricarboxylate transporter receptor subunit TctC
MAASALSAGVFLSCSHFERPRHASLPNAWSIIVKLLRHTFEHLAVGAAALGILPVIMFSHGAWSQARTIKLINPFPPGGTADIIGRVVTEQISRTRGIAFVLENRPGAGTVIGAEAVARATPDGNTLLINSTALLISSHLRTLNFDPLTAFAPICELTQSPQILFVNSSSPYRTMGEFVAAARAKPGELTLASTGPATNSHISFENFKRAAKVAITFVPFPGNAPTVNAVLGGHVTVGIANYADLFGHFQAGKLRALATVTATRLDPMPDLPTVAEAGYKEFEYVTWFGILAPAKTPDPTVTQLSEWFAAARQAEEVKAKLVVQGLYPMHGCGAEFAAFMRKEYEKWGRVIREANIKAE